MQVQSYKFSINDNFELFGALGFHIAEYSMTSIYSATLNFSFGIGGDFGIRYLPIGFNYKPTDISLDVQ